MRQHVFYYLYQLMGVCSCSLGCSKNLLGVIVRLLGVVNIHQSIILLLILLGDCVCVCAGL